MLSEILETYSEENFDFRQIACPSDPLRHRFAEWKDYYRLKAAIARALKPSTVIEIGVRYGYSAAAFLHGHPQAEYLGIDIDADNEDGGVRGALAWARSLLPPDAVFLRQDSQQLDRLPGDFYDLGHVDGQQDGDGTFHDLLLTTRQCRFVLLDSYLWKRISFLAANEFLSRLRPLIEYWLVLPEYAGELLIKTRASTPSKPSSISPRSIRSGDLEQLYDDTYYLQDCGGFEDFKSSGGRLLNSRLGAVASISETFSPDTVLDLGCGRGELSLYQARQGRRVDAADYSAKAIELARSALQLEDPGIGGRVRLFRADVSTWQPPGTYDIACAVDLVEHLHESELQAALETIRNHLRPEGILLVHTYPNRWNFQRPYRKRRRLAQHAGCWLPKNPRSFFERQMHINEQSPASLRRALMRVFPHVHVWVGSEKHPGFGLLESLSISQLAETSDIYAVAGSAPPDLERIKSFLSSAPLTPDDISLVHLTAPCLELIAPPAGQLFLQLELQNRSASPLNSYPPNPVHLAYRWSGSPVPLEEYPKLERLALPATVPPGSRSLLHFAISCPSSAGSYALTLTLVQEWVAWFHEVSVFDPLRLSVSLQ